MNLVCKHSEQYIKYESWSNKNEREGMLDVRFNGNVQIIVS